MASRSLRLSARSPEALLTALLLPVLLMVVFVYLFGGAVSIGTAYVDYVAPGVLLLCAVTGASTTAVTVCQDMTGGIIDRFRSMDVRGTAVLAGHVVASLLRNLASTVLVSRSRSASGSGRMRHQPASPPRSACCCSSWPPSPGSPRRSGCWSARPRRPTRS
jgi:ABC-2 type transporter.